MSLYDAIEVGTRINIGSHTFQADEIVKFASRYDPQPFHLSEDAARESIFGGLCASGWHTLSVWMGLNVKNARPLLIESSGYEGPLPRFGPSPGVSDIRWTKPVFVGDRITYFNEVTAKRHLNSRPGWGLLSSKSFGQNQHNERVVEMQGSGMIGLE